MLLHGDAGVGEDARHFLRFAEHIGVNHGCEAVVQHVLNDADQLGDDFLARRQAIRRITIGAFHHEDIRMRHLRFHRRSGRSKFEIASVE
jgi:hypothetical protein